MNQLQKRLQGFGMPKHIAEELGKAVLAETNPLTGRVEILAGEDNVLPAALASRKLAPKPAGVLGRPALDFTDGIPEGMTMVAQGGTVNLAYNPTGWHDGTGCLEFTPTGANPTMRAFLNAATQFQCRTDDGWSIEFMLPVSANKASTNHFNVILGKGAVSAGTLPADRTEWRVYSANAGGDYNMEGVIYRRFRWDIANSDAKMGPVETSVPSSVGTGVAKNDTVNWLSIYSSDTYLNKTFKIKALRMGGRSRAELVVTFDNADREHSDYFVPSFMLKGWQVSPQLLSGGYQGRKDPRNEMWLSGSDMNANDIVDRNISNLDYATIDAASKQWWADMKAFGFDGKDRGQTFYVYNNNGFGTEAIRALVDNGFIAGRAGIAVGRFTFTEGGIRNSMRLGASSWDGRSVQSMKDQIDRCIEYGCTIHIYFHKLWAKAQLVADLPAATPIGATETPLAYFTRVSGLGETATVTYMTARGINDTYTSWVEDQEAAWAYAKTKVDSGVLDVLTTSEWMSRHGLVKATP